MKRGRPKFWSVISELIAEGALPMDAIQANSLELTAGSVDTVRTPRTITATLTAPGVPPKHSSLLTWVIIAIL